MSSHPAPARPDAIRAHNLSVMLRHIHHDGALTRAELTQRLGVSRSTVGALVADLTQLGLVDELVPIGGARVGRPSHVVGPHSTGPIVFAVDIDVAHVTVAAVGLGGAVLGREAVPCEPEHSSPEAVVQLVIDTLPRLRDASAPGAAMVGVGVSVPGTVDRHTGHIGFAPNLDWHDAPFGARLAELLPTGVTIAVGNDADLAVLAEHSRGGARGIDDVVFLLGRVGIGAGIIANGRPLRGHDGYAGELGHNVVDETGPECHCGKRGCVETYIGEGALLRLAGRPQPPSDEATAAVFADARRGDSSALRAVRCVAQSLGRAIASLVNTLNPECVVLGGYLSDLLDIARPEVVQALREYALGAPGRTVQLVHPAFGADAALLGAAELAFADLLADPLSAGVTLHA
ncbi:MAG TPA: ROK family transcriptional regulator [Jatrophihabitans sp.]|nr:ROK family transcriptional regulator [Jatrophihabitans sp.]